MTIVSIQQFLLAFIAFGTVNTIAARATWQSYDVSESKAKVLAKKTSHADSTNNIAPAWWDLHSLLTPRLFMYAGPKSKAVKAKSTTTTVIPPLTTVHDVTLSKVRVARSTDTTIMTTRRPARTSSPVYSTSPTKKTLSVVENTSSTVKTTTHMTGKPGTEQAKPTPLQQWLSESQRSTQFSRSSTPKPKVSSERAADDLTQPTTAPASSTASTTTTSRPTATTRERRTTASPIVMPIIKPKLSNGEEKVQIEDAGYRKDKRRSGRVETRENFDKKRRRNKSNRRQARYQRRLMKKIRKTCKLLTRRNRPRKVMDPDWIEERIRATERLIKLLKRSEKKSRQSRIKLRHHRRRKFVVDALFRMFDHSADGVIKRHEFEAFLEVVGIVQPRQQGSSVNTRVSANLRLDFVRPGR